MINIFKKKNCIH